MHILFRTTGPTGRVESGWPVDAYLAAGPWGSDKDCVKVNATLVSSSRKWKRTLMFTCRAGIATVETPIQNESQQMSLSVPRITAVIEVKPVRCFAGETRPQVFICNGSSICSGSCEMLWDVSWQVGRPSPGTVPHRTGFVCRSRVRGGRLLQYERLEGAVEPLLLLGRSLQQVHACFSIHHYTFL